MAAPTPAWLQGRGSVKALISGQRSDETAGETLSDRTSPGQIANAGIQM